MPRPLLILSIAVFSLLEFTSALNPAKRRLCTEICWINDINNYEICADRCYHSDRPTDEEADACESCIDICAVDYLGNNPCLVVYTECRRGCFHKYFPMFMPGYKSNKERRSVPTQSSESRVLPAGSNTEKELRAPIVHAPGVPSEFRKLLAGTDYPVGTEVCQISCRVRLMDTILSNGDQSEECIDHCLQYPTHRDQELQVALDCGNRCPAEESAFDKRAGNKNATIKSQPCLQSCASEMINKRKASASAAPRPTRAMKQKSTSLAGYANKAYKTGTQKYTVFLNNSNSSPSASNSVRKTLTGAESYDTIVEAKSAATNYLQSPQFLFHAACTMIIAAAVALHMI